MATPANAKRAREALDQRLVPLGPPSRYVSPRPGWVRAIRDALGMTAADLAARMGVTGPAVRSLENKEREGGARLSSLQRAAEAMDCTFVYAFIPNTSLQQTVARQAASIHDARMGRVRQTMALEAQEGEALPAAERAQLEAIIGAGRLWSQRDGKR
jgi:predicted DNA-binding mobile mystery protein A